MDKINVLGKYITVTKDDYISLTDMLKAKDGEFFISDWLRNKNTIEYLGIWERIHNPNFNYGEYAVIRNSAGLNRYKISVKEWTNKTNAIGLSAKTGRYGGTCNFHSTIHGGLFDYSVGVYPVADNSEPVADLSMSTK